MEQVLFYGFLILTLIFGMMVAFSRSPLFSLLSLLGVICSLSVLFYFYGAGFLALVQLIVYGGGILVLFLFVIMIMRLSPEDKGGEHPAFKFIAPLLFISFVLGGVGILLVQKIPVPEEKYHLPLKDFALKLFKSYGLPFEAITLLLLASAIGAFIISRRKL